MDLTIKRHVKSTIDYSNCDPIKIISIDFTCRTCLSNIWNDNYKINERINTNKLINSEILANYQKHFELLQLKILPNDGLPQRICPVCENKLKEFHLFYSTCQQSQLILNEFFNKQILSPPEEKAPLIDNPLSVVNSVHTPPVSQPSQIPIQCDDIKKLALKNVVKDDLNNQKLTNDFLLRCNSCGQTFNNKFHLKLHLNEHYLTNNVKGGYKKSCNKCGQQFTKLKAFQYHYIERTCVPLINPICRICNKVFFGDISALEDHLSLYHPLGKLSLTCCICKKTFKTAYNFNKHMNLHKEIKLINVDNVETVETIKTTEPAATTTIALVETLVNHECSYCGEHFNTIDKYKYHMRRHKFGVRPFLCDICAKKFITKSQLKSHMFSHMGVKPFSCKLCDKKYAYNHSLIIHMRQHTGERPYRCDQCGQDFADKELLKYHLGKHTGIKTKRNSKSNVGKLEIRSYPYCCHLCSRSFKLPSSLSKHMKIHDEIRNFICAYCGNGFKLATTLRIHINSVHLKLRPYKCEYCDKTFSQKNDRNLHMRLHNGVKPHECSYCKKRFQTERVLRVHLRLHTGEKPYKCDFCKMDFMTYKILAKHSTTHEMNRDELFMRTE